MPLFITLLSVAFLGWLLIKERRATHMMKVYGSVDTRNPYTSNMHMPAELPGQRAAGELAANPAHSANLGRR